MARKAKQGVAFVLCPKRLAVAKTPNVKEPHMPGLGVKL